MNDYRDWFSLREIDLRCGTSKGTAFRAFRALEAQLVHDVDFLLLRHDEDAEAIAALRQRGRIYPGSVNVVLLGASAAQRLIDTLQTPPAANQ